MQLLTGPWATECKQQPKNPLLFEGQALCKSQGQLFLTLGYLILIYHLSPSLQKKALSQFFQSPEPPLQLIVHFPRKSCLRNANRPELGVAGQQPCSIVISAKDILQQASILSLLAARRGRA